jgi:flavin reductase (DIM6/NTAB) family NADH-FMN oxidoreductase RutF
VVAEGYTGLAYCLLGPTTDLLDVIRRTDRFLIHVCTTAHRPVADVFAGLRPSPGGLFHGLDAEQTSHGPRLPGFTTVAFCTYLTGREESYSTLVAARIDSVEAGVVDDPLLYYRGAYRRLSD